MLSKSDRGNVGIATIVLCVLSLSIALTAGGVQAADYARIRLWDPIGMWQASWLTDRSGNTLTYQSVIASAREFAKFGLLYLREGQWDGAQIVPRAWILESTRPSQNLRAGGRLNITLFSQTL